jgi:hypothetical protein
MNRCIQMLATAAVLLLAFNMEARAADVPYISGGTGADERQELLAKERDYNLKIITADKSGDYLAPGTYTIQAISDDKTLTRTVTIAAQGLRQVDFRWDVSR